MCTFRTRVHRCGHYTKTLKSPCEDSKKSQDVCTSGSEDSQTTGGWCYLDGCDMKPNVLREGPGKLGPRMQQQTSPLTQSRKAYGRRVRS
ncbi:hypothetical protein K505DRAFT_328766 [Melanomma pulvis-pyrius CBS 109.77]|uniref:Uncharacterized protein n=1 Tax=Melanomma pulvis-pyrius CBS 109.77 TaxID=1314802 RepID=A0A6A6WXR7_9PLEO|nr:hypothetical protein K505DRAFT_328766 [Melanomma pulvis-pyrius CBS 109.77]